MSACIVTFIAHFLQHKLAGNMKDTIYIEREMCNTRVNVDNK